jgi:hypothetical protein
MLGCVVELEERVAPDPDLRLQVCSMGGRGLKLGAPEHLEEEDSRETAT